MARYRKDELEELRKVAVYFENEALFYHSLYAVEALRRRREGVYALNLKFWAFIGGAIIGFVVGWFVHG